MGVAAARAALREARTGRAPGLRASPRHLRGDRPRTAPRQPPLSSPSAAPQPPLGRSSAPLSRPGQRGAPQLLRLSRARPLLAALRFLEGMARGCTAEPAGARWRWHRPAAPVPGPGAAVAAACGPQAASPGAAARAASSRNAARASKQEMPKLRGEAFWRETLRSAHYVVAPMVDQSELAWRLLSRRHGAQLCYTPMLHAQVFLRDANYRRENLYDEACPEDRPLIVQFCANDPEVFVQAALLAQDYCDAIDLNLGCPQMIAKRGHYGAFLQEEWDLLQRMILLANEKLSVPITCKIRVFPDIDKTVKYAQMLEKAGCQLLTVHGRTKEQKGPLAGVASWEHIQAVRKAVNIPVFANGNIQCLSDVEECIRKTGVHGVMSAEGNLHNPALFEGRNPLVWEMAEEYLEIVRKYPCPLSYVRAHLFKLWHHTLQVYQQLREELAKVKTLEGIVDVNRELKLRCQEEIANQKEGEKPKQGLPFFHWICQPYIRPGPKERCRENGDSGTEKGVRGKRALEEEEDGNSELLSKNKQKKKLRNPNKSFDPSLKPKYAKCDQCGNPKGTKCVFNMCRGCCKKRAFKEVADCPGHGLLFKTKYEKSLSWQHSQRGIQTPEISQRGDAEVGETAVLKEAGDSTG